MLSQLSHIKVQRRQEHGRDPLFAAREDRTQRNITLMTVTVAVTLTLGDLYAGAKPGKTCSLLKI